MDRNSKILVYGYGNPGRQDDGLGSELVRQLEGWVQEEKLPGIDFDANYQLNIEDAEAIADYDLVIFADASLEDISDFAFTEVTGETDVAFTTHAASPGYIVKLCSDLFERQPKVYLLHIKGYEWEFQEGISERAKRNLNNAQAFMKIILMNYLYSGKLES